MADVGRKLSHKIQVPCLARRVPAGRTADGMDEGLVVRVDDERPALHSVAEVANGEIHRQQFPAERAVSRLSRRHRLREVRERLPRPVLVLLEHGADPAVRCVHMDGQWRARHRVCEQGGIGESALHVPEGARPGDRFSTLGAGRRVMSWCSGWSRVAASGTNLDNMLPCPGSAAAAARFPAGETQ